MLLSKRNILADGIAQLGCGPKRVVETGRECQWVIEYKR